MHTYVCLYLYRYHIQRTGTLIKMGMSMWLDLSKEYKNKFQLIILFNTVISHTETFNLSLWLGHSSDCI